jgi:hypothetical protein
MPHGDSRNRFSMNAAEVFNNLVNGGFAADFQNIQDMSPGLLHEMQIPWLIFMA